MAATRRPPGTGALLTKKDSAGREVWYGQTRVGTERRIVKKKLGLKRAPGGRTGMTRTDAEKALRAWLDGAQANPATERLTVAEGGARLLKHLAAKNRKKATLMAYESMLRVHLVPYFGGKALDAIMPEDVEAFMVASGASGSSVKTTGNAVSLLHGIFEHAIRRGWLHANPVKRVEKPKADASSEIRFLETEEVEALLRHELDDDLGRVLRVMYLTAATTGMRQGELVALRWMDVDWLARKVRVRRSYVRGEMTTPKSRRGSRAVPLATRTAAELERLSRDSVWAGDEDLVFAHPHTGGPIDRSRLLKRYKATLKRAGVREVRFHDLRHTFGTHMAAQGMEMRALQELMGHRDYKTTLIYADYKPNEREADMVDAAFGGGASGGASEAALPAVPERGQAV